MAKAQRIAKDVAPFLAEGEPVHGIVRAQAGVHPLVWAVCAVPLFVATWAPVEVGTAALLAVGASIALAVVVSTLMRHRIIVVTGAAVMVFSTLPMLSSRPRRALVWLPRDTPLIVGDGGTWRRLHVGATPFWVNHRRLEAIAALCVAPDALAASATPEAIDTPEAPEVPDATPVPLVPDLPEPLEATRALDEPALDEPMTDEPMPGEPTLGELVEAASEG
jgi:hypothetical protein